MAEKYTYADVIIDPEDPRVEIGKEYYFGDNVGKLLWGVRTGWETEVLRNVYKVAGTYEPFYNGRASFSCIIRRKEPEKKYVPFDLSKEEDRNTLRGKWVQDSRHGNEWMIVGFYLDETGGQGYKAKLSRKNAGFTGSELLERFTFLDGTPIGKLKEAGA